MTENAKTRLILLQRMSCKVSQVSKIGEGGMGLRCAWTGTGGVAIVSFMNIFENINSKK
jgi:hypothetical protein